MCEGMLPDWGRDVKGEIAWALLSERQVRQSYFRRTIFL